MRNASPPIWTIAVWGDASKNYRHANHALVSNKSDFHCGPFGIHRNYGHQCIVQKINMLDVLVRLVQDHAGTELNGFEKSQPLVGLIRERREELVLHLPL